MRKTLHQRVVAGTVGSDHDDFSTPVVEGIRHELEEIGTLALFLRVPQDATLRADVAVDEFADGLAERLLLVRADPDEEPTRLLNACRQSGAKTGTGADADATAVDARRVTDTRKLQSFISTRHHEYNLTRLRTRTRRVQM